MKYIDSSVLLRVLLNEEHRLGSFADIAPATSSILLRVECLRSLDRARRAGRLDEEDYVSAVEIYYQFEQTVDFIPIQEQVLTRATQPFSIGLGTLDAIHLSSAVLYRERVNQAVVLFTHDKTLGTAAKLLNFEVRG